MMRTHPNAPSSLDKSLMRFEVRHGMHRIDCTVSNEALDAVAGLVSPSTPMLRRKSFDRFRTLIHAAAVLRLEALPAGSVGPITLTRSDLRGVPPVVGTPSFGSGTRA